MNEQPETDLWAAMTLDLTAKFAGDATHASRIRDDIATSMNGFCDEPTAGRIADAIIAGQIPYVEARL